MEFKLDYMDISAFIKQIREEALSQNRILSTIEDLQDFLDEEPDCYIHIVSRN